MIGAYSREWALRVSDVAADAFFHDLETLLRLGPQWNVKDIRVSGPLEPHRSFEVDVEYDRSEQLFTLAGHVEEYVCGKALRLELTSGDHAISFSMQRSEASDGSRISFHIASVPPPAVEDLREYDLWTRSILNYLKISESRSPLTKAWKWFLDRWWLRMTQSGKRMVFFIVLADGFSVLFLVGVLLWWKLSSGP